MSRETSKEYGRHRARGSTSRLFARALSRRRGRRRGWMRQLLILSSVIGPGLITANVDNDATGITGYSLAGAQYGYGLLWAVVLVTISLAVVQEMVARMGVVTGKGLADLIREHFVELVLGLITAFAVVTINVLFAFSQWNDKVGEMQQENEKLDGMAPRPMREL